LSRSKDRERFLAMQRLNPEYQGFRGHGQEPTRQGNTPLQTMTCSVCGRRRNVAMGIALEQGDDYICLSCQEAAGEEDEPEDAASQAHSLLPEGDRPGQ
jgi:hypothetical protein